MTLQLLFTLVVDVINIINWLEGFRIHNIYMVMLLISTLLVFIRMIWLITFQITILTNMGWVNMRTLRI